MNRPSQKATSTKRCIKTRGGLLRTGELVRSESTERHKAHQDTLIWKPELLSLDVGKQLAP